MKLETAKKRNSSAQQSTSAKHEKLLTVHCVTATNFIF
jgi:hypothetical protein